MAIRPILTAPDPRLKAVSTPVETVDAATRKLIDDMVDSMYAADLHGSEADAVGGVHRIHHVVDQLARRGVDGFDRRRDGFKARIGRGKDGSDGHAPGHNRGTPDGQGKH